MIFELRILGTSAAVPTINRFPSSQILNLDSIHVLLDCGEGSQIRMREYFTKTQKISHIFISHLHGDHVFGLPGLISSFALGKRTSPLTIIGPIGIQKWLSQALSYVRTDSFQIHYIELDDQDFHHVINLGAFEVHAFPLIHRIPSYGYRFDMRKDLPKNIRKEKIAELELSVDEIKNIKSGENLTKNGSVIPNESLTIKPKRYSFAYCTDTMYFEKLQEYLKDIATLYIESTFDASLKELAIQTKHCTTEDAARVAKESNAKRLITGHFSSRYTDLVVFQDELRQYFENSYTAHDGDLFDLTEFYF